MVECCSPALIQRPRCARHTPRTVSVLGVQPKLKSPPLDAELASLRERWRSQMKTTAHLNSSRAPLQELVLLEQQQLEQQQLGQQQQLEQQLLEQMLLELPLKHLLEVEPSACFPPRRHVEAECLPSRQERAPNLRACAVVLSWARALSQPQQQALRLSRCRLQMQCRREPNRGLILPAPSHSPLKLACPGVCMGLDLVAEPSGAQRRPH